MGFCPIVPYTKSSLSSQTMKFLTQARKQNQKAFKIRQIPMSSEIVLNSDGVCGTVDHEFGIVFGI